MNLKSNSEMIYYIFMNLCTLYMNDFHSWLMMQKRIRPNKRYLQCIIISNESIHNDVSHYIPIISHFGIVFFSAPFGKTNWIIRLSQIDNLLRPNKMRVRLIIKNIEFYERFGNMYHLYNDVHMYNNTTKILRLKGYTNV